MTELLRTQFYKYHKEQAKLVEFCGYELPLYYNTIIKEHNAVRMYAGIFDVSHMGRLIITGIDAKEMLNYLVPTNIERINIGQSIYTVICDENGGIIDDITILQMKKSEYILIVNCINKNKVIKWIKKKSLEYNINMKDITNDSALIALQGPQSRIVMKKIFGDEINQIERFHHIEKTINKHKIVISRTGYTGENGFEICIFNSTSDNPGISEDIWNKIINFKGAKQILPCGLGARDSLRIEAGMCLYGLEINEKITPIEAKLNWIIDFTKNFIGKTVLLEESKRELKKIRVGIKIIDNGIPRSGYKIISQNKQIGEITSGTFSPILQKGIAMGYINYRNKDDKHVYIKIRNNEHKAIITKMPFYNTEKYGWKRK